MLSIICVHFQWIELDIYKYSIQIAFTVCQIRIITNTVATTAILYKTIRNKRILLFNSMRLLWLFTNTKISLNYAACPSAILPFLPLTPFLKQWLSGYVLLGILLEGFYSVTPIQLLLSSICVYLLLHTINVCPNSTICGLWNRMVAAWSAAS